MALAGRDEERREVAALLADGGALVLRGGPGIGRTALFDDAAAQAGDARVLRASATRAESGIISS